MSNITNLWVKKRSIVRPLLVAVGYISICVQSSIVRAEQEWWFDVEVIVFKRNVSLAEISEKFPLAQPSLASTNNVDLFTPYLHPDFSYLRQNLGICNQPNSPIYEWGPAHLETDEDPNAEPTDKDVDTDLASEDADIELTSEDTDTELASEDALATEQLNQDIDSAIKANTAVEPVDSTTQLVAEAENVTSTIQEMVVDLNSEATHSQELVAIIADNELTEAETDTNHEFELFTAESILGSLVTIQIPTTLPCVYPEQLPLLTNPFDKTDSQTNTHRASKILRVPVNIDGVEWTERYEPYLLPQSLLTLTTLFEDISRQQDLIPLLHAGWRQEVKFGEDQALPFRLFAGKNFANIFTASGELLVNEQDEETFTDSNLGLDIDLSNDSDENREITDLGAIDLVEEKDVNVPILDLTPQKAQPVKVEESLFSRINKVLSDDSPIQFDEKGDNQSVELPSQQVLSALWELDGKLKVYLQYVGRTPYLHIDTNLEYRSPIFVASKQLKEESNPQNSIVVGEQINQENYLQSVQFDQLRRVISKQLHYFDHPLFGMVVHITRYNRPEPIVDDQALLEKPTLPEVNRAKN